MGESYPGRHRSKPRCKAYGKPHLAPLVNA